VGVLEYPADRGHGTAQNHHVSSSHADMPTRAELLAALSVAVDLGLGQPAEHMLRSALIATRLADRTARIARAVQAFVVVGGDRGHPFEAGRLRSSADDARPAAGLRGELSGRIGAAALP
jgi:hypothetical protein